MIVCFNINCNVLKLFIFEKLSYLKGRKTDLPSAASQSQSWARLRPEASNSSWVFHLAGREPALGRHPLPLRMCLSEKLEMGAGVGLEPGHFVGYRCLK